MSFLTNLAKFNLRSKVYPPLTTKGALLDNDVLTEVDDNWTEAYDAFVALYRRTFKLDSATEDLAVITSEVIITETYVDEVNLDGTDGSDLETITAAIGSEFDFILRNSTGADVKITSADNIAYDGVLRDGEFIYLSLRGGAVTLNPITQLILNLIRGADYVVKDVEIDTGEIDASGEWRSLNITSTDSSTLALINMDVSDYEFLMTNSTGETISITTTGNISTAYRLADGDALNCIMIGGVIYISTSIKSMDEFKSSVILEDDETFEFPFVATLAEVDVSVLGNTSGQKLSARFLIKRTAGSTIMWNSGDFQTSDTSDTDDNFCVYEGVDTIAIKNRLGEVARCLIRISYM